jgi:hypothetical protein
MNDLVKIDISDDSVIYYDLSTGMYWVRILQNDGTVKDIWFDAYEEKEIKDLYLVYGNINESGDTDTWISAIFDNKEQAHACAKYYNIVETQDNVSYYVSDETLNLCKWDYIEDLNKLNEDRSEKK